MSKKLSRFIAGILLACMVAGSIPAQGAYGAVADAENEEVAVQDLPENVQDTEEITTAPVADGAVESSGVAEENEINFVYIESPYLETPGTQRIVFSFEQQITGTHVVTLTVENEAGSREEWELSQQTDHLYLFEKEYSGDAYTGTYRAVSLNYYGEENKTVVLEDAGVEAEFGVNEEYNGIEELQPLDSETAEDVESQVKASVVTIDENGVTRAQDSIAAALNEVSADTARISTYSAAPQERSGNIVVALDPGHDSSDAGARGNGLKEEELTLKIANYCKEELEQYAGVSVYMTRTGPDCPYGIWGVGCIEKRVQAAVNAGAQIFVSLHLNASVSSSANGAEVIVPNYSWKYSVGAEGHTLGQVILDELVKLGLTNRGIYSKDTTINERYPDGSISDYFGVQIYCKEQGIPGIIVEHAFISNSGDANRFLTTEAGLKQLGVADATGIAKYLGLSKGRWETDSNGNTYYFENGTKVFGEKLISGKWYYFDPQNNGAMKTGWHDLPGKRVYYANTGEMLYGEQLIEGKWYCFEAFTGKMITGWYDLPEKRVYYAATGEMVYGQQEIEGEVYYFELFTGAMYRSGWRTENGKKVYYLSSGKRAKGEVCIDNSWRYFDEKTGEMVTGWHKFPEKTVYYSQDGRMLYGEQLIEGKWYCFNSGTGAMITGWYDLPEKRVYYAATGEMVYGQQEIEGEVYYFELFTGAMYRSGWRTENGKKVYYLSSGKRAKGEVCIDNSWRYFDEKTGEMVTGWHKFPEKTVYYSQDGRMLYGEQLIEGKWYCFNSGTGAMITGWYDLPEKRVYYAATGEMVYGQQEIEGEVYYFELFTGAMYRSGWRTENGKKVYYLSSGKRAKGEVCIDNSWRYFDEKTGEMVTGWHKFPEKTVYYSQDGRMLYGEQLIEGKWYCFNSGTGAMITGWHNLPEKRVYYAATGEMLYGEQLINNKWFYLELGTGKMLVNIWINGAYYGPDGARVDDANISSYSIEGTANTTVAQMVKFYEKYSPISYPSSKLKVGGAPTLESFALIYYEEAIKENIRPEVAWCQSMLETGYLKFGGQVKIEQFNFAGLGATDGGAAGADFSIYGENGVRMGVRAQIQHLKAYASPTASKETLAEQCVDPRFDLVSPKGCASDVIYLGQKENPIGKGWATAERYGYHILDLILRLLEV